MNVTNFKLPATKQSTVVWHRRGETHEVNIPTPKTNKGLVDTMFVRHQVGPSEIRAVKSVWEVGQINVNSLADAMMAIH